MNQAQFEKRVGWLAAIILLWAVAILVRLLMLQVVHHDEYVRLARRSQEVAVKIPATRGSIFDRRGHLLAMSTRLDTAFINPLKAPPVAADILSPLLSLDRDELRDRLKHARAHRQGYLVVKAKITPEESYRLRALHLDWIGLERASQRHYPNDGLAAHVLGSVDFAEHGNGGIEQAMEPVLRGQAGAERVLTDVNRNGIESYPDQEARAGTSLTLTIDERIQFVMERELAKAVQTAHGRTGSAVAIDPNTGDIYAIASYPSYDPSRKPGDGEDPAVRFNNAVSVPFEPGSMFKVITLSAALEATHLRPDSIINCGNGTITLFGRTIHEAHRGYGSIPMADVLAYSSNIGAIQIGMRVGQQKFYEYVKLFGFGQRTGIELPAEARGLLRQLNHWGTTSLASMAMGHEISVTELQMARAVSVIANGGLLVKPRVILKKGDQPVAIEQPQRIIRPETAITMRQMMEGVVLYGTGKTFARLDGYTSGGKTGSAQIFDTVSRRFTHMYNASFVGFAPLTNPAIVVVVTVNGTHLFGGTASAPAYKAIMEEALRVLNVPKDLPDTLIADKNNEGSKDAPQEDDATVADLGSDGSSVLEEQDGVPDRSLVVAAQSPVPSRDREEAGPKVPDFQGKTKRAVIEAASAMGLEILLDGSGIARVQQPPPGSVLRPGERIRVQFAR